MSVVEVAAAVDAAVDNLAALDFADCPDPDVRDGLVALVQAHNRLMALATRLIGEFDRRELCHADAQRSTKAWLKAFTRLGGAQAHGLIKSVATLKLLPSLNAAFEKGSTSFETVNQIRLLQDKEPDDLLRAAEPILTALATQGDPDEMHIATNHLQHRVHEPDPDDPEAAAKEHEKEFAKRQLTCTRLGPHWRISGQLDAETGTALHAVLQGLMSPPGRDEVRTAAQRRHDALADLLNQALRRGLAGGTSAGRTQLGVLVPWALMQEILRRRHADAESAEESDGAATGSDLDEPAGESSAGGAANVDDAASAARATSAASTARAASATKAAGAAGAVDAQGAAGGQPGTGGGATAGAEGATAAADGHDGAGGRGRACAQAAVAGVDRAVGAGRTSSADGTKAAGVNGGRLAPAALGGQAINEDALAGMNLADLRRKQAPPPSMTDFGVEPAYLQGYGPIPHAMAERLACDAEIYRILLAPDGQPMDVGRTHRIPPPWIRRALNYRDRGCRWPGCGAEVAYTDAHHYRHWQAHNGTTSVDNLILLCRYHHMRVHEGHWDLRFDPATSKVMVIRPDGSPYELAPTEPWDSANTRRDDPPSKPDP